jgi:hypothetical protein
MGTSTLPESYSASTHKDRQRQETIMPVLLVPFLIGVPVVLGGGYIIYHLVH